MTQPETGVLAIEIDSKTTWRILCDFEPHFKELSADDNVGRFILLNFNGVRWSIWTREMIEEHFDHIGETSAKIPLVSLVAHK